MTRMTRLWEADRRAGADRRVGRSVVGRGLAGVFDVVLMAASLVAVSLAVAVMVRIIRWVNGWTSG